MRYGNIYLNLSNGEKQECHVTIKDKLIDGVHAVYIDAFSNMSIDSEFGAGIELEIENIKGWMADYRHSEFWCQPAFGIDLTGVPNETQGIIYQTKNGSWGVILPVVSEEYKCVLEGAGKKTVLAKLFSWYEYLVECRGLALLWAEGRNPYTLLQKCTKVGLKLLETGYRIREERRYPEIFEYLGWCSWDAFEIRVDEQGLLAKCQEFKEKNIPVKWALIDDMWAEVHDFYEIEYQNREEMFRLMHSSKLYSFKADPKRFPNGLKQCVNSINAYGIKVGIWHPTTGYWMGIDPKGDIFKEYKDCLIQTEDGRFVHSPSQEKAYQFYNAFHNYLRKCSAEFVKIDNQSMSRRFFKKIAPIGEVARQYHDAMEASVGKNFDNQVINCMGMASEDMWNRSVSPISRCSNDFQPENREWFIKHIMQCSYNCLIQGQFYYCDWDMWWTDDGQAVKNSVLRAISGGPIYVSDKLNRSRAEILWPLILSDGRILRCDKPAMPTIDCLIVDPTQSTKPFKLQNICNGSGIIAAFNLNEKNSSVKGTLSPEDVDGLVGEEYAVYEHFTRTMCILKRNEKLELELKNNDEFYLYILVPLVNGNGVIGRIDKYISPATVKYSPDGKANLIEDGSWAYISNWELIIQASQYSDELI